MMDVKIQGCDDPWEVTHEIPRIGNSITISHDTLIRNGKCHLSKTEVIQIVSWVSQHGPYVDGLPPVHITRLRVDGLWGDVVK